MTTTLQRRSTDAKQSIHLFPLEVKTADQSLIYVKRLTAVAVSNILYLRNVFNEDCYGHRKLDSIKLRILTENCKTLGAKQIVQWIRGCFDAMEKKYLKQITLGILTDPTKPEELVEAYTFRYSYDQKPTDFALTFNGKSDSKRLDDTTQDIRHSTTQLLRSLIILTQSLDSLPENSYLTMKLLYNEDITPRDYEPPGFTASETDSFTFNGKTISINAGEVITPFHAIKVKIRTDNKQFEDFVPTQDSSLKKSSQLDSDDGADNCSPMKMYFKPAEDVGNVNVIESKSLGQAMASTCVPRDDKRPENIDENEDESVADSVPNSPEVSVSQPSEEEIVDKTKQSVRQNSINSSERNRAKCLKNKLQELKVCETKIVNTVNNNKRKIPSTPAMDFEVSPDSVFDSLHKKDKRMKASKTQKNIPIGTLRA